MNDITENGKYYVPTIEEFHDGFEYEYFDGGATMDGVNEWRAAVFNLRTAGSFDDGFMIEWYIEKGYCRVKHIWHDDLIALGWNQTDLNSPIYVQGKYSILIFGYNKLFRISHTDDTGLISTVYYGKILNKIELKIIMDRTEIIRTH